MARSLGRNGLRRPDLGHRLRAQLGRADEARQAAARDPRRAAGADRGRLRADAGGGYRPAPVVGPLPRQAEDRDVHAAREAPERDPHARRAARDRRGLEQLRPRRRRADDAPEHPAPLARALLAAGRLRRPRGRGPHDRRRLRRHRPQPHRLPRRGPRRRRALRRHALVDEATADFYGNPAYSNLPRKHKNSISTCAHRCNAPEINCISLVGVLQTARGLRGAGRRRALLGAAHRPRPRRLGPEDEANEILGAVSTCGGKICATASRA